LHGITVKKIKKKASPNSDADATGLVDAFVVWFKTKWYYPAVGVCILHSNTYARNKILRFYVFLLIKTIC